MRVTMLTASASRSAGGVFESVRGLAHAMYRPPEMDLQVLAVEDEHTGEDLPLWSPVPVSPWPPRGPRAFGFSSGLTSALSKNQADLLHLHGLWMYPSVVTQRWHARTHRPCVVSPHGMLDPWALANSRWKKRLAAVLYEKRLLQGTNCLHALCGAELAAIRSFELTNPVCVIPNGVEIHTGPRREPPAWRQSLPAEAHILLYLGRLHPKKGLANLISGFAAVARRGGGKTMPWHLAIAGWDQNGHRAELEQAAARHGVRERLHFIGPQFGSAKEATLQTVDAFILPSLSEGLPMAVLEAWVHSLPVLMTPQCNLPEGFAAHAALRIEPDAESIAAVLQTLFAMPPSQRAAIGERGHRLVAEEFAWEVVARKMEGVYRWLLGSAPRPAYVDVVGTTERPHST